MPDNAAVTDCLCIGCEYDLRALPEEGQCPECGLAIDESRRAFQGDIHIPIRLKIVSLLLTLVGSSWLVWFVLHLVARHVEVPIEMLATLMGFGLLRLSNRWRIAAVAVLGLAGAVRVLGLPFAVLGPAPFEYIVLGVPIALLPRGYAIASSVLPIIVIGWMMRVLMDPRLRALCRVLGPRMHSIRPREFERFQRIMAILCGAGIMVSFLLAGMLLLYAEQVDDLLLCRGRTVQAQATSAKAVATWSRTPQMTMELDWGDEASYVISGPHFDLTSTRAPMTGRARNDHTVVSSSGTEVIESRQYMHHSVSGRGKSLDKTDTLALDWLHHMDSTAGEADIRLTCRVPIEIVFKPKAATGITDLKTNRVLQPPFVLEPGEYHLQAKLSR